MHGNSETWSYTIVDDPDGTCHVDITDEDGVPFPVVRQVTHGQAERLVQRIAEESQQSRTPIKAVIRDPYFMAATVIMLKRLPV